jgi:uncharacterized protein (TIGR00297 family)
MQRADGQALRKSVHFLTGFLIIALSLFLGRHTLLLLIIAGLVFSFATFNYGRFDPLHRIPSSSLGTLFYPVGVLSSFLVLYDQPLFYFRAVIGVLTISDVAAWLTGQHIRKFNVRFRPWHDSKSLWGTAAFAVTSAAVWLFYLPSASQTDIVFLLLLVILSVNLEAVSFRGSDNLTIPLGLSLLFPALENQALDPSLVLLVILFFAVGCYMLYRWQVLDRRGSLSAYLLGIWLAVIGIEWLAPVLFFFISSVLLTRLHTLKTGRKRSSNRRNAWQVLANIIWALLSSVLFMITQNELFIYFFIALLAAVTADTWASELGPLFNKKCFSVADFRMHNAGITGGISAGGTIAALIASATVSIISLYLFFGEISTTALAILTASGFMACFADTFAGAFIEEKLEKLKLFKPRSNGPTPNDLVNIIGSATAPLFYVLLSGMV